MLTLLIDISQHVYQGDKTHDICNFFPWAKFVSTLDVQFCTPNLPIHPKCKIKNLQNTKTFVAVFLPSALLNGHVQEGVDLVAS